MIPVATTVIVAIIAEIIIDPGFLFARSRARTNIIRVTAITFRAI
jgi:hypothetical protein